MASESRSTLIKVCDEYVMESYFTVCMLNITLVEVCEGLVMSVICVCQVLVSDIDSQWHSHLVLIASH